ncbi:MAG: hypothetical protein MZV70_44240 [Desulfobacterales bacterium]|nr:hypothetical protein [Desulfobacterales bacterium]
MLQAIKDLIKKNQEDASGTGTADIEISCSLFMSPSHGKPGTTVLLRATRRSPRWTTSRGPSRCRFLPYAFHDERRFEDLLVFEGTVRGGSLETTWQCPTDTGSEAKLPCDL